MNDPATVIFWADLMIFALLCMTTIVIVRTRGLFGAVMLTGIYSFLSAGWMMALDAPDVAFTEAAVGVGISTVLMLATLHLITREVDDPLPEGPITSKQRPRLALLIVGVTGAALIYGTVDMPAVYDPNAPIHQHVAPRYLLESPREMDIPNVVTSVLGSYRAYDTLGETAVVFTAGVAVMVLLGQYRRRKGDLS